MAKLPPAEWTRREDLARLVAVIGSPYVRWVGGAVRDTLLGNPVQDIDAATMLEPDEIVGQLRGADIRTVPTGIAHGTVTALLPGGNVEITTLRHDVSTDGRRATIAFAHDWRDDAARRDFTINALYCHPDSLEIDDYFGGLQDLDERRIRFIGKAEERIREDHLRILRYYRFQCRFGSALDVEAEEACARLAPMLQGLSRERVAMELLNLLALPDPLETIRRMFIRSVLPVILPEAGEEELDALGRLLGEERRQHVDGVALRRLAALLPADEAQAGKVASRLRLSTAQQKRLVSAAGRMDGTSSADPRALAYRLGNEEAMDRLLLWGRDVSTLRCWEAPQFPLKGGEIVARGVAAGPQVAKILHQVEDRWVAEGFPDRARVMELLAAILPH